MNKDSMSNFEGTGFFVNVAIDPSGSLEFRFNKNGAPAFRRLGADRSLADMVYPADVRHELLNSDN